MSPSLTVHIIQFKVPTKRALGPTVYPRNCDCKQFRPTRDARLAKAIARCDFQEFRSRITALKATVFRCENQPHNLFVPNVQSRTDRLLTPYWAWMANHDVPRPGRSGSCPAVRHRILRNPNRVPWRARLDDLNHAANNG